MAASLSVGTARYALDKAAAYAQQRAVWGAPIGTHQGLAHPLAMAKIELEQAKLMMQKAATLYDAGDDIGAPVSARTWPSTRRPRSRCAPSTRRVQTHGGNGFASEYGLGRCWPRPGSGGGAGEPGDDPELRGPVQPRPAEVATDGPDDMTELVHYAAAQGIATLTLDSPANRNALSAQLVAELGTHLAAAGADHAVRAVVLTHTGSTFCAGADLKESVAEGGPANGVRRMRSLLQAIVELPNR